MDPKLLVPYKSDGDGIIRNDETITYENPFEEIQHRTTKHSTIIQEPARSTDIIESFKEFDNSIDTIQSRNDRNDTIPTVKEETLSTQLLNEYKYCKDVISYITSKDSLDSRENNESLTSSSYRNDNNVFIVTLTNGNGNTINCAKISDTMKSQDTQKPCLSKPCDDPKPCQKSSDTLSPCDTQKYCDSLKPCKAPKPSDTLESWEKESDPNTCSTKKSDSHCNEKSFDDCNKLSKEPCNLPESQLSDCILKCLETEKSKGSVCRKPNSTEDNTPCIHKHITDAPEVKKYPNKCSSTSSFQNFVESSATTLSTFKTTVQDFIGTVCNKTRETAKFITDEGFKVLGLKEKPCGSEGCKDCDSACSKAKKCDFNIDNDSNVEEIQMSSNSHEDVSRKSTNLAGMLENMLTSKLERSSKYDVPKVDEAGMSTYYHTTWKYKRYSSFLHNESSQ